MVTTLDMNWLWLCTGLPYGDLCVFEPAKERVTNASKWDPIDGSKQVCLSEGRCKLMDLVECEWMTKVVNMWCAE